MPSATRNPFEKGFLDLLKLLIIPGDKQEIFLTLLPPRLLFLKSPGSPKDEVKWVPETIF
jgi:hypothetical protein